MAKQVVLSCLASAAMVAACGGGSSGVAPDASSSVLKGVQDPLAVGMQCAEFMAFFPVDYASARSLVPTEYEPVSLPSGQALLAMPIQDCGGLVLNGRDVASAPFVHFWIQVAGPDEYVEVAPGAVAKRDYYYSVFEHTTSSNAIRQPVKQLGFEGTPIESMTLGDVTATPQGYSVRLGGVVEKAEGNHAYGYRWQEQVFPAPAYTVPVVHSFFHTKNAGMKAEADVRCMASIFGAGYVQLSIDPLSEAAVFGASLMGQTLDLTMQCAATMSQLK